MRAVVVGAGVVGLSAAIRLLEDGADVRVVAREHTPSTTSDVAAAVYFPYRAGPPERVLLWARESLGVFRALAKDEATGVALMPIVEPVPRAEAGPWWAGMVDRYHRAAPAELPPGYGHAWIFEGPVIEMP